MKILKLLVALTLAASLPLFAGEAPKKGKKGAAPVSLADQTLKKFEKAALTAEQVAKVKELAVAAEPKLNDLRKAVNLTDAQKAAQKETMAKAKAEGKKGKAASEAVEAAMNLSPEQKSAQKAVQEATTEFNKSVTDLLTPEQKKAAGLDGKKHKGA